MYITFSEEAMNKFKNTKMALLVLALADFITYLSTRNTSFLFCGGLFLTAAGVIFIIENYQSKK